MPTEIAFQGKMVTEEELLVFYRFYPVENPAVTGQGWLDVAESLGLKGTFILAPEGTNSALAGPAALLERFTEMIAETFDWSAASVKRMPLSPGEEPYARLKLKVKSEICTFGSPSDHERNAGRFVTPAEFERLLDDPDTVLLDTRNNYEARIGTFRGARVIQSMEHFRELPEHLDELEDLRGKRVIGFCTGGIRCEKAIPYLLEQGFDAYQLDGGIIKYLQEFPDSSAWEGECFVFDERYSVTADLRKGSFEPCPNCGQPSRDGNCVMCGGTE